MCKILLNLLVVSIDFSMFIDTIISMTTVYEQTHC